MSNELIKAIVNNERYEVERLLALPDIDVNKKDENGRIAIIEASLHGNIKIVEALIKAGADINQADEENRSVLFWAVFYNSNDFVSFLIKKNAQLDMADKDGITPLIVAAACRKIQAAKALIAANANIEIKDNAGFTALDHACNNGYLEIVEELQKKEAEKKLKKIFNEIDRFVHHGLPYDVKVNRIKFKKSL